MCQHKDEHNYLHISHWKVSVRCRSLEPRQSLYHCREWALWSGLSHSRGLGVSGSRGPGLQRASVSTFCILEQLLLEISQPCGAPRPGSLFADTTSAHRSFSLRAMPTRKPAQASLQTPIPVKAPWAPASATHLRTESSQNWPRWC